MTECKSPVDHYGAAFSAVLDTLPDALVIVGSDGLVVFANQQAVELFGYRQEELVGQPVEILVPDRFLEPHAGFRAGFFNSPSTRAMGEHAELFGKRRDGSEFPVEISLSPLQDKDGLPALACASIRDVSEHRRIEARQRWQTEFSAGVINALPGIFYLIDRSGRMRQWNRNLEEITGYSSEEIERMSPLDFVGPPDQPRIQQAIEAVFDTGQALVRAPLQGKNGRVGEFHLVGHRIKLGNEDFLTGLGIDITDRVQTENMLEYVSGLQRLLVEASRDFIASDNAQIDELINKTLGRVGAYCDVDRSYLFRFKQDRQLMDNTHEWCAPGIKAEIDNLQNLPREAVPMVVRLMENREVMHVPRVADLGKEWANDRSIFESEDIESLMLVPIIVNESPYGFIGFDSVRRERTWSGEEIGLLQVLSELIGTVVKREMAAQALRDADALRTRAEELAHLGSWEWYIGEDTFRASSQWRKVTGCYDEPLDRNRVLELAHPDDLPAMKASLDRTLKTGDPYSVEHRIFRADTGELRWIKAHAEFDGQAGKPARLYGFSQDITERKYSEAKIAESEALYRSVVDHVHEVVFQTDEKGHWTFLNAAWEEITGYSVHYSLGRPFDEFIHSSDRESSEREFSMLMNGHRDRSRAELRFVTRQGDVRWLEANLRITRRDDGRVSGSAGTMRDITEQREAERRIRHMAHYDSVTELPNRILAIDRLNQLIKTSHRTEEHVAVLFLDLDYFKKVNDNFGHEAGDEILWEAGRRLQNNVREQDTVARFGGDEFLILLGGLKTPMDAQAITEKLLDNFRTPFRFMERDLVLTASVGIAIAPTDGDSAQDLLRNADMAMYQSKAEGRNTYHYFTEAMNSDVKRRLSIEEQLRDALERNELKLVFQPIVNLSDGAIVGGEALARWHSHELGEVPPDEFIPIAEQSGLIGALGDYILGQALKEVIPWRSLRPGFRVSVNVSPQQFRDPGLGARMGEMLQSAGVSPQALQVEVTESVLLDGNIQANDILNTLHRMGVSIAMDDFGTGYASLSYLRRFPFDTLKIDRSFVSGITDDMRDRDLVLASLSLARSLNLNVVAEGVETPEQLAILRELGCDLGQGFFYGKPMDAEAFTKTLRG
jgi:diguanylate cyclase (GGDEF)-like protein/PAS domain S-box-containing protein